MHRLALGVFGSRNNSLAAIYGFWWCQYRIPSDFRNRGSSIPIIAYPSCLCRTHFFADAVLPGVWNINKFYGFIIVSSHRLLNIIKCDIKKFAAWLTIFSFLVSNAWCKDVSWDDVSSEYIMACTSKLNGTGTFPRFVYALLGASRLVIPILYIFFPQ